MRYHISVNGELLMMVRYLSDAAPYIRDRISLGQDVVVLDTKTVQEFLNETAEHILAVIESC